MKHKLLSLIFCVAFCMPMFVRAQADTIGYDNGTFYSNVGVNNASATIYWAVKFESAQLSGFSTLDAVMIYDASNCAGGTYTLSVYNSGTNAPGGTAVATQSLNLTGHGGWSTFALNSPYIIDTENPLWLVMSGTGVGYPAPASAYTNNPNGSWISTNGTTWQSVVDAGVSCTWMLRGIVSGSHQYNQFTITGNTSNPNMGNVTGDGTYNEGANVNLLAVANPGYRFTHWDDNTTDNPKSIIVTADISYTAYFADLGHDTLHYDMGEFSTRVGMGASASDKSIWWGIRIPAAQVVNHTTLQAVQVYNYMQAGPYNLYIYQGGDTMPELNMHLQSFNVSLADSGWTNVTLTTPQTLDPTMPLWIVFNTDTLAYPASMSDYAGNPDGSWISTNGTTWQSVCDAGIIGTWMIRAIMPFYQTPTHTITVHVAAGCENMGTVTGGGTYEDGTTVALTAIPNDGYEFTRWGDGFTDNPRTITVQGDATYYAYFQQIQGGGDDPDDPDDPDEGIDDVNGSIRVYASNHDIYVNGAAGQHVWIYDVAGRCVTNGAYTTSETAHFTMPAAGVYVVRVGEMSARRVVVQ